MQILINQCSPSLFQHPVVVELLELKWGSMGRFYFALTVAYYAFILALFMVGDIAHQHDCEYQPMRICVSLMALAAGVLQVSKSRLTRLSMASRVAVLAPNASKCSSQFVMCYRLIRMPTSTTKLTHAHTHERAAFHRPVPSLHRAVHDSARPTHHVCVATLARQRVQRGALHSMLHRRLRSFAGRVLGWSYLDLLRLSGWQFDGCLSAWWYEEGKENHGRNRSGGDHAADCEAAAVQFCGSEYFCAFECVYVMCGRKQTLSVCLVWTQTDIKCMSCVDANRH
jgi:hypothetical protein